MDYLTGADMQRMPPNLRCKSKKKKIFRCHLSQKKSYANLAYLIEDKERIMTLKTPTWQPEQPLPRYADRKTLAAIVTHNFFPISHRILQTWPLSARRPNRAAVYEVAEALELAEQKLEGAISYKQGGW